MTLSGDIGGAVPRTAEPGRHHVTIPLLLGGPTLPPRPSLKKSLRAIERAFADIAALAEALTDRLHVAERKARRKAHKMQVFDVVSQLRSHLETPKRRAQRKLHGSYIGHLRHLKPAQKLRVKAVKAKRGYEAAIKLARRIANG